MEFLAPRSWDEALRMKAERPEAVPISGGTDLMVDINFDRRRPEALLDLTGVAELGDWDEADGTVRIGAGVSFTRIIDEVGDLVPGLAIAARTVGSPQIRNRGTLAGNLATASPAGDALPPLVTAGASVHIASVRGERRVAVGEFFTGPKRSVLGPDELIRAVEVPVADGPQQFAKVGTRNAMVIAVCSFALALHPGQRRASGCIGSAGPTVLPVPEAEGFLAAALPWESADEPAEAVLAETVLIEFARLVAGHARPIDDVRGTAAYRRHAVGVLARRTLQWAWDEHRRAQG
jgi:CO/xanthine dehydrogenase FAD-binding subunit